MNGGLKKKNHNKREFWNDNQLRKDDDDTFLDILNLS